MKLIFLKHILLLLLPGLLFGMQGCAESNPDMPQQKEESGMVTLTFDMADMSRAGATNPDGHEEWPGEGSEIQIFGGGFLHVYVHDVETGELKLHFNQNQSSELSKLLIVDNGDGTHSAQVTTHALTKGKKYRLSVMANCQDVSGDLYNVSSSFQNDKTSSTSDRFLQNPQFMPFSGFKTFTLPADIADQQTIHIGDLWLLRAVARIDVVLNDDLKTKWEIDSAFLKGVGKKLYGTAYASPKLINVVAVESTDKLTWTQMFNPRRNALMDNPGGEDIEMLDYKGEKRYFRIYLPEQENPLPSTAEEIMIGLKLVHKQTGLKVDGYMYLRDSFTDKPLNIIRNHIYRFNITTINPFLDVDFDVITPGNQVIDVPSFN